MLQEFRSQKITWDKANNNVYEKIEAHEGDSNGRKLIVQVLNDGIVEDLTGSTLSLAWQTKYRASFGLDAFASTDITKGQFEIYYPTGMLTKAGIIKASLVIVDSNGRLESKNFDIVVNKTNADDEAVQSDNSFTALTEALVTVNQYDARIAANTQGVADLDTRVSAHLAESARKHITESGTNPNGSYIRFDDGTMLCWKTESIPYTELVNGVSTRLWDFPSSFLNNNYVHIPVLGTTTSTYATRISCFPRRNDSNTKSQAGVYINVTNSVDSAVNLNQFVIGRWK